MGIFLPHLSIQKRNRRGQRGEGRVTTKAVLEDSVSLALNMEEGARSQGVWEAPKARKGKETDSFLWLPEGTSPDDTLTCPLSLIFNSDLQDRESMNVFFSATEISGDLLQYP